MAGERGFTLFGMPTPEEIRARIGRVKEEDALTMAALPAGRGMVYNASMAGSSLAEGVGRLFGRAPAEERAALEKINTMQGIFSQAAEKAGDDPRQYLTEVTKGLISGGFYNEAFQALERSYELDHLQAQTEVQRATPGLKLIGYQLDQQKLALKSEEQKVEALKTAAQIKDYESKINYRAQRLKQLETVAETSKTSKAVQDQIRAERARLFKDYREATLLKYKDQFPDAQDLTDLPVDIQLREFENLNNFQNSADPFERLLGATLLGQFLGTGGDLPKPDID